MQYNTISECEDLKGISKKWLLISVEGIVFTILGACYSMIAALMILMITSFSVSIILPIIVFLHYLYLYYF